MLNQEVFRMRSKVPFDRFMCRYAAKFRCTNSFPTHSHVTSPITACRMRLGCSSILGADMTIRLLSTNATVCMYLGSVRIGSSLDSWTRRTNIGVQSVTRYCLGLRLDLSRGVCRKNRTSSTPIDRLSSDGDLYLAVYCCKTRDNGSKWLGITQHRIKCVDVSGALSPVEGKMWLVCW